MTSSTLPTWSFTHLRLNKHNFRFGFISCFFTSGLLLWRHQPYPRDPWLICVSINTTSGLGHVVWILAPDWLRPIPPCSTTASSTADLKDLKLSPEEFLQSKGRVAETASSILANRVWFSRNDLNQSNTFPLKPKRHCNLCGKIEWSTVSKAGHKSSKMRHTTVIINSLQHIIVYSS